MIQKQRGHIVNMSSIAGFIGTPTYSVYAATKFGVRGFTEALRREVEIYGIRVSGIYPGGVRTEFMEHTGVERKTGIRTPKALRLTAEEVAREVLRIVIRGNRTTIMPRPMKPAVWINRFFPGVVDWIIERGFTHRERS
jgi:short-subunit dehydrogenase